MFGFNFDKRTIYIVMAVLILLNLRGYLTNPSSLITLLMSIPAVLIAITFHEYAHAFAADKLGDDTPRREGRLSLNPLAHLDPIGSIMLIFAGFGWGKPVGINPRNFNRKISQTAGEAIVSFAGPAMNFILAIVISIIHFAIIRYAPSFLLTQVGTVILALMEVTVIINIGLGVFNLIPLPPLDGSKILRHFLPFNIREWFDNNQHIFYIIFIAIWITGVGGQIISPVINLVYNGISYISALIFTMF